VLLSASCKGSKEVQQDEKTDVTKGDMATSLPSGNEFLFWQVRHKDMEDPSYLFGTIHIIGVEDYFLGANVKEKLEEADRLVMEIDFDQIDMSAMALSGLLPDNKTIADYLSEDDYELVATILSDSIGMSRGTFEGAYSRMKPIFLQQLVIYKFLGENPVSYESNLDKIAEDNGVPSDGLETFEDQLSFLDQIPLDEQFADLLESVKNWNETKAQYKQLLDAYKAQNLELLNYLIEVEMENPQMRELLLDKRNSNWIPKLEDWFAQGSTFVAVGAGHLGGEFGVINLLRRAGYEVWPYNAGEHVE